MPPSRALFQRLIQIPDWLHTRTGQVSIVAGALLVIVKAFSIAGLGARLPMPAALSIVTLSATVLALTSTIPLARNAAADVAERMPWRLFSGAMILLGGGALLHVMTASIARSFEPLAHRTHLVLEMSALVMTVGGILSFPTEKLPRNRRVPAALDCATLLLAGFLAFWIYALHPMLANVDATWTERTLVASYTVLSLVLLGGMLSLVFRRRKTLPVSSLVPLVAGIALLVITAAVPACNLINTEGAGAEPAYVGWPLFALCLAVAGRSLRPDMSQVNGEERPALLVAVPFASTALVGLLLFTSLVSRDLWEQNLAVLLPATFSTLVLIVVRQTVIARENLVLAVEMKKAKEIAESANSARLQFLANISHDLRTPLNGVLGCAQILLREKTLTPKQKELIKTMQGCAEHLRNLINDLLDLSKLEADRLELSPSAFDLRPFLDRLMKTFGLETETKNLVLDLDCAPDLPEWIMCDRKRLQQILGNLVHNAIKFTERGRVTLRTRKLDGTLIFEVHDTGCGILPDKLGELFQPFHVVDERSIKLEGTGLGLSICKKLARKMGGDITVQSVLGKGSIFSVRLPLEESAPVVEVQRTIVDYQGRRRRILIIDDQPANRIVLRTMLEPLDFLIDEAGEARTALENIRFAKPDIILMDLMMPGMDGFALCRQVAALDIVPRPACLAVSALSGEDVQARCREAGFNDLLHKPVNFDLLLEALHTHAAVEWTYGLIQPAPNISNAPETPKAPEEIVPPSAEEIAMLLDLARRGFVRNIETRAGQLAQQRPECAAFSRRVMAYVTEFKVKELADWLTSLTNQPIHGTA